MIITMTKHGIVHAAQPHCDHGVDLIAEECAECGKEQDLEEYFARLEQGGEYPVRHFVPATWQDEENAWMDKQR